MSIDDFYKKMSKEDKTSQRKLGDDKSYEFIPTGSWIINQLIGDGTNSGKPGGLPRGTIAEVFGNESSGKTTFAMSVCKQAQLLSDKPVIFLDFERSFHEIYAKNMGLDLSKTRFILWEPTSFEHGIKLLADSLMLQPLLIVVDSVSAMIPKEFISTNVEDEVRIGKQAQLMSRTLPILVPHLKEKNTCLVFTNQLRSQIKKSKFDPGPTEETSGGRALKFYSSLRIRFKSGKKEYVKVKSNITGKTEDEPVNLNVKATIVKNKIDRPYMTAPVYIRFGEGFDNITSMIELGINNKVIKKSAAYLKFETNDEVIFNIQGKEKLRNYLIDNNSAFVKLRDNLKFKQDEQAKKEYAEEDEDKSDPLQKELNKALDSNKEKNNDKS